MTFTIRQIEARVTAAIFKSYQCLSLTLMIRCTKAEIVNAIDGANHDYS